jgi:SAM-dependent methyltransferase
VYISGEYLAKHPGWHSDVSPQKAQEIMKMIKISGIKPKTIGEVGCGAGGILVELQKQMDNSCAFQGYDISPQSIEIAREKENEMLHFKHADFIEQNAYFDLLLMIDMIEHVEDCFSFLRNVKSKGEYKMIQFALDLTVGALLRPDTLLGFRSTHGHVGHVHYFTKNIALAMLEDLGYEIVDHFYTLIPVSPDAPLSWEVGLLKIPRAIFYRLNTDAAVRFIGGYKLLVLAK